MPDDVEGSARGEKQEQKKMNAIVLLLLFCFYLLDASSFFTTLP